MFVAGNGSYTDISEERLAELIDAGLSVPEMAEVLGRSVLSVRRWLRRYGLQTHGAAKEAVAVTAPRGAEILQICRRHGETAFVRRADGYLRCRRCAAEAVSRRRRKVKEILVEEAGGCCRLCGYSRCKRALEFHHLDPGQKRLGFAKGGITLSLEVLRKEAAKCVLLCSNCHAEVESGLATLPVTPDGPLKLAPSPGE